MSPVEVEAAYVQALASASGPGTLLTLIRAGNSGFFQAHGWVTEFIPIDMSGGVQQGRRNAILLASDVVASGFPLPFAAKQDRLRWVAGAVTKTNAIIRIDDATISVQGVLIAYKLDLDGA